MKRDPVVWRLVSKPAAGRLAPSFKVASWQLQHWGCGSRVSPRSSLPAPPIHRHILSTECLQLTAPPAFLIGDMGVCLLPPLVTFHHKLPPPPFQCPLTQGLLGEACFCKLWEEGKGPQYPKSPLGKNHTLSTSVSTFLGSSRILPLNNTGADSQLWVCDFKSSSVPALQTRRMCRGKVFSHFCKSTWKTHLLKGFLQLPT